MDGEIDIAALQGAIEFPGEKSLAASLGERAVLNNIAARLDDDDLEVWAADAVRSREPLLKLLGLRQRQRAAAGADLQSRREGASRRRTRNCQSLMILGYRDASGLRKSACGFSRWKMCFAPKVGARAARGL